MVFMDGPSVTRSGDKPPKYNGFVACGFAAGKCPIPLTGRDKLHFLEGIRAMQENATPETAGAVTGGIRVLLRLEGLALFTLSVALYSQTHLSWFAFIVLFFAPDISFLAYLAGPRAGAIAYNAAHDTFLPIVIVVGSYFLAANFIFLAVPLIWLAHIGFDRALGYGLKYEAGFGYTHLGLVGKAKRPAEMDLS
jgi:hypothetical protein